MTQIHSPEQLLSLRETSALTSLSRPTLYRHINSGELPTVRIGGRRLVQVSDLHSFIASRKTNGSAGNRAVVRASAEVGGGDDRT